MDKIISYQATIFNNSDDRSIDASFSQRVGTPLLDNTSDYYLAVSRFNIPQSYSRLFKFEQFPTGRPPYPHYTITIQNTFGTYYTEPLVYIPYTTVEIPPKAIYYIHQFVQMTNVAIAAAHTASGVAGGPPIMVLNIDNNKFYIETSPGYTGRLFFSDYMFTLFRFFPAIYQYPTPLSNGREFEIILNGTPTYITPVGRFQFYQEESSLFLWNELESIEIVSSKIPVNLISTGANKVTTYNPYVPPVPGQVYTNRDDNNDKKLQSLTNFKVSHDPNLPINRSNYQYNAVNPLRLVQMIGGVPLNEIEFKVVSLDKFGSEPETKQLLPGERLSVLFTFYHKSIIENIEA